MVTQENQRTNGHQHSDTKLVIKFQASTIAFHPCEVTKDIQKYPHQIKDKEIYFNKIHKHQHTAFLLANKRNQGQIEIQKY